MLKDGWVYQLHMYGKDGSSLSVWNAYRGDGWVKKGQNLAYVLCTQPLILFPTIVKMTNNIISDRGSQNLMLKDFI